MPSVMPEKLLSFISRLLDLSSLEASQADLKLEEFQCVRSLPAISANLMGCKIWIANRHPKGAKVSFTLPSPDA